MIHIAILLRPYLDAILTGEKTIESRLTINNRAPFDRIEPGERIYFKVSSGPFLATAVADHVLFVDNLTPGKVNELRRCYNDAILGDPSFWQWKRNARYATLIWLTNPEPIHFGPSLAPQRGVAWVLLPDSADVYPQCTLTPEKLDAISVTVTGGNLRNNHVYARRIVKQFPDDVLGGRTKDQAGVPITIELPDGPTFKTDVVAHNGLIRSRGHWAPWFKSQDIQPGDRLAFVRRGRRRFAIHVIRADT
ncbi:MAG: ASCH domain-containing protein [Phycisphaerales bacterium]|nr:ASCH domain-containing protein [Phycisphaerales bacterium]